MQTKARAIVKIKIRKDLFDQSSVSDIHQKAMANIDMFRESIRKRLKGKSVNTKKLIEQNKKELEDRTLNALKSQMRS